MNTSDDRTLQHGLSQSRQRFRWRRYPQVGQAWRSCSSQEIPPSLTSLTPPASCKVGIAANCGSTRNTWVSVTQRRSPQVSDLISFSLRSRRALSTSVLSACLDCPLCISTIFPLVLCLLSAHHPNALCSSSPVFFVMPPVNRALFRHIAPHGLPVVRAAPCMPSWSRPQS